MTDLTLTQIEAEPEKWECAIRSRQRKSHGVGIPPGFGPWWMCLWPAAQRCRDDIGIARSRDGDRIEYALFARPAGSSKPFRKVKE